MDTWGPAEPGRGHRKVYDESHVCSPRDDGRLCREGCCPSSTTTITLSTQGPPQRPATRRPHAEPLHRLEKDITASTSRATKHTPKRTRASPHGQKQPRKQANSEAELLVRTPPSLIHKQVHSHRTLTCSHTHSSHKQRHRHHSPPAPQCPRQGHRAHSRMNTDTRQMQKHRKQYPHIQRESHPSSHPQPPIARSGASGHLSHCPMPMIPNIMCQVGALLIQKRPKMAPSIQPPMSTQPIQRVQMAGAHLMPLGGRQGWGPSTATLAVPSTRAYLGVPRLGTSMGQADLQERGYKLGPGKGLRASVLQEKPGKSH